MSRRHVIISGTGRAGTTFLVQLCTALGLDTGFSSIDEAVFLECNAGMERELAEENAPYIVKAPQLCASLDTILKERDIVIEHAIVPMRELTAAAESRRSVVHRNGADDRPTTVNGGLWGTSDPSKQESVLAEMLYKLIETIARHEIPLTLLSFPRLVHDRDYLLRRLRGVFPLLTDDEFSKAFARVARPELVHDFGATGSDRERDEPR